MANKYRNACTNANSASVLVRAIIAISLVLAPESVGALLSGAVSCSNREHQRPSWKPRFLAVFCEFSSKLSASTWKACTIRITPITALVLVCVRARTHSFLFQFEYLLPFYSPNWYGNIKDAHKKSFENCCKNYVLDAHSDLQSDPKFQHRTKNFNEICSDCAIWVNGSVKW